VGWKLRPEALPSSAESLIGECLSLFLLVFQWMLGFEIFHYVDEAVR